MHGGQDDAKIELEKSWFTAPIRIEFERAISMHDTE
jgi:hypothetical protein